MSSPSGGTGPAFGGKSGENVILTHEIPAVAIRLAIDPASAASRDDTFTLSSSDGKYKKTLTVKDDKVDGDEFVDIVFDNLKTSQQYTLEVNPGAQGQPYKVFENLSYQELMEYYSMLEEDDGLEGVLPPEQPAGGSSGGGQAGGGTGASSGGDATPQTVQMDDAKLEEIQPTDPEEMASGGTDEEAEPDVIRNTKW